MPHLAYVNVFAENIERLSAFYATVFGFREVIESRSPIFRLLDTGRSGIGFNAPEAYELLGLADRAEARGMRFMLTIDVDRPSDVDALVSVAEANGAHLIKPPYETYYGTYQAVLSDPEDNVFRINAPLIS